MNLSEMKPPIMECNIGTDYQNKKVNQYLAGLMLKYDIMVSNITDKKQELPQEAKDILTEYFDLVFKVNRRYHNISVLHPILNKIIDVKQYKICDATNSIIEYIPCEGV